MSRNILPMNGKRINSLEDLRENFNAKQMLAFYKAKRLHAWLEEQGYTEELENINSFEDGYDDDTLLSMLMAVFDLSDEQIAAIETEKEKTQCLNSQAPIEEVQPAAIAENVPPAPEPETVAEADVYSATDLKIKWSFCGISKIDSGNSFTADTLSFEELPEKGTLPRLGKMKCDGLCFADGCFVGCFTTNSYLGFGLSSDGIHWNMEDHEELSQGMEISFRDTDISFIIDDPNDLSGYIQNGNGNWQKVTAAASTAAASSNMRLLGRAHDDEPLDTFVVFGNNIFYKETKSKTRFLSDFYVVLSKYSQGKGWIKCELPGDLPNKGFFIAESGGYYFVPSSRDQTYCPDVLMYSRDGNEWKSYDFSEMFGKKWQKIKNAVRIGHIAFGDNRIIIFDSSAQHYLLGEIIS